MVHALLHRAYKLPFSNAAEVPPSLRKELAGEAPSAYSDPVHLQGACVDGASQGRKCKRPWTCSEHCKRCRIATLSLKLTLNIKYDIKYIYVYMFHYIYISNYKI